MNAQRHKNELPGQTSSTVDAAILRALERPGTFAVPEDFAARVRAHAVARPRPQPSYWAGFGPRVALASAVAMTALLFAFAPHAMPSFTNIGFDIELLLLVELGGVAWWFSLQPARN